MTGVGLSERRDCEVCGVPTDGGRCDAHQVPPHSKVGLSGRAVMLHGPDERKVMPESLRLRADSLLSKWGFGDGDTPEIVYDYCEANGIEYQHLNWHATLVRLVREHLLLVLEQDVETYEIETIHNPIRAQTVGGVLIDATSVTHAIDLSPEYVDVPLNVVMQKAVFDA